MPIHIHYCVFLASSPHTHTFLLLFFVYSAYSLFLLIYPFHFCPWFQSTLGGEILCFFFSFSFLFCPLYQSLHQEIRFNISLLVQCLGGIWDRFLALESLVAVFRLVGLRVICVLAFIFCIWVFVSLVYQKTLSGSGLFFLVILFGLFVSMLWTIFY